MGSFNGNGQGWHKSISWLRKRYIFNMYLLLGGLSIVVATTVFTIRVSKSVERQSYLTTRLFADLGSRLLLAQNVEEVQPVIEIINEIEVPFVITDNSGRPWFWNEPVIGIPMPDYKVLMSIDPSKVSNPAITEILSKAQAFDQENDPFGIFSPDGQRVGTLHYGNSALSIRIRYMPYVELMIMVLFFLVILWALQSRQIAEQKALFAGMAKETAHQLGTPLTSIMGWVAILEEKVGRHDEVMVELNRDVTRLSMISARFSQIGSMPQLDDTDLNGMVDQVITYFQRRLPHLGGRVQLRREGTVRGARAFQPRPAGLGFRKPDQEWHRCPEGRQGHHHGEAGRPARGRSQHHGLRHRQGHSFGGGQEGFRAGLHHQEEGVGHGPGPGAPHRHPVSRGTHQHRRDQQSRHHVRGGITSRPDTPGSPVRGPSKGRTLTCRFKFSGSTTTSRS